MLARVYVTLKKGVLDPQGKTVHKAIETMGYTGIEEVRQGKLFEIKLADGLSKDEAEALLQKIADQLLANPVIEEFKVEIADETQEAT